jgi:chloramphenicol 3-O-phosphotransferase
MKINRRFKTAILLIITEILALSGCSSAKKSSDIQAVRAPVAPYMRMSCDELYTEQRVLIERLDMSRKAVDKAYDSDKNTEIVTWILFAPAAFFLEGNQQQAAEFSATKGQYDAVQEAIAIMKCTSGIKTQETPATAPKP